MRRGNKEMKDKPSEVIYTMMDNFIPYLGENQVKTWKEFSEIKTQMLVDKDKNEIFLYGVIVSEDDRKFMKWLGLEDDSMVSGLSFRSELKKLSGDITLRINSPGGNVSEAAAVHSALIEKRNEGSNINVMIDGYAGSAASFVMLVGNNIKIAPMGGVLIHNARIHYYGPMTVDVVDKIKANLQSIDKSVVKLYTGKTKKSETEVRELMGEEKRLNADEAIEFGLVDEVLKIEKTPKNPDMIDIQNFQQMSLLSLSSTS